MSKDWFKDIIEFHEEFNMHIEPLPKIPRDGVKVLRQCLIKEEVEETIQAIERNDLVEIADGIADSIVVLLGTTVSYGIDINAVFNEVHKTNMAKIGGEVRADGKQLKPKGWKPPRIKEILENQSNILGEQRTIKKTSTHTEEQKKKARDSAKINKARPDKPGPKYIKEDKEG